MNLACHRIALLVIACMALGCGAAPPANALPTVPAQGIVMLDGRPAEKIVLVFYPQSPSFPANTRPTARSAANGQFTLSTFADGDGAPEGTYDVVAMWIGDEEGGNRLPERYGSPRTSGLRVEVKATASQLPTIELQTQ